MEELKKTLGSASSHTVPLNAKVNMLLSSHLPLGEVRNSGIDTLISLFLDSSSDLTGGKIFFILTSIKIYVRVLSPQLVIVVIRPKETEIALFDSYLDKQNGLLKLVDMQLNSKEADIDFVQPTAISEAEEKMSAASKMHSIFLPEMKSLSDFFRSYDLIFKPKENIGGDFYWCHPFQNRILFALGDATGHGIEGAMGAIFFLNQLSTFVRNESEPKVENIIAMLHEAVQSQANAGQSDFGYMLGCEIILCDYNPSNKVLRYISCGIDLFLNRSGKILKEKSPYRGISKNAQYSLPFVSVEMQLHTDDIVWVMSDGIKSQIGDSGKVGNKNLLTYLQSLDNGQVATEFYAKFDEWRGSNEQMDDISLLCVQV